MSLKTFNERNCMNTKIKIPVTFAPINELNSWKQPIIGSQELVLAKISCLCGRTHGQDARATTQGLVHGLNLFVATNNERR